MFGVFFVLPPHCKMYGLYNFYIIYKGENVILLSDPTICYDYFPISTWQ